MLHYFISIHGVPQVKLNITNRNFNFVEHSVFYVLLFLAFYKYNFSVGIVNCLLRLMVMLK